MLNKADYNHWLGVAKRLARKRDEAEDLLHESLLAAVQARRTSFGDPQSRAWFAGILRNKAMMTARSAGRRKRRETAAVVAPPAPHEESSRAALSAADESTFHAIRSLPAGARIVAILSLHGLSREEIAYILELSPEALRQRLTTLRKRWTQLPVSAREDAIDLAHHRHRTLGHQLESGLIRRALLAFLHEQDGVGTHDPDGHLIVFGRPPASTSRPAPARQRKGKPKEV